MSNLDEITKESRESHENFHQHWSILAGGSLTVLIAFVKDFASSADYVAKDAFFFALLFITLALILSPLRNFISTLMVGLMGQYMAATKEKKEEIIQKGHLQQFFCNTCGLLAIGFYIFGMIMVVYSLYISYLAY